MKLRIEKAVYGGAGLARMTPAEDEASSSVAPTSAGKAVFVPYSLPGELVEARLTASSRGYAEAALQSVIEPAPARIAPGCEYFAACGGCHYQHSGAEYQLRMKLDVLTDTLRRARLDRHVEGAGAIGQIAGPAWGYRNRLRLELASPERSAGRLPGSGRLALCYRERGSHRRIAIERCPIAAPIIERAIAAMLRLGMESGAGRLAEEVEFFSDGEGTQLLVSLWRKPNPSRASRRGDEDQRVLEMFAESLQREIPELASVGLLSAGSQGARLTARWGASFLHYPVAGRRYRVSLGSFFQVNRFLLPELYRLVAGERQGKAAWDLYAGVGFFSSGLAFDRVIAVESAPSSSADLECNLADACQRVVKKPVLDFLRKPAAEAGAPDLIIADPPRAGLGAEVCSRLNQIAASQLVYVSCDPATLARDLQALLQSRYRLDSLHLVDLFPQTFHLETVAVLRLR